LQYQFRVIASGSKPGGKRGKDTTSKSLRLRI
jgi:hypothetical protein